MPLHLPISANNKRAVKLDITANRCQNKQRKYSTIYITVIKIDVKIKINVEKSLSVQRTAYTIEYATSLYATCVS